MDKTMPIPRQRFRVAAAGLLMLAACGGADQSDSSTSEFEVRFDCDTTAECRQLHGEHATDCVDSASDESWCSCGGRPCAEASMCDGLVNAGETVCCPRSCGACGGSGCSSRPGGPDACCSGPIAESGRSCSDNEAPCLLSGAAPPPSGACTLDRPVPGLPTFNFTMHNVLTKTMVRADFCQADKWYSEWLGSDGRPVQEFSLHRGDDFSDNVPGGRPHARVEFEEGLRFKASDNQWHELEARMLINKRPENTITLAQIFKGCCGPDARVEIRTNGEVRAGSLKGGTSNVKLSPGSESFIGRSFKIRLRSNGTRLGIFFNGERRHEGPTRGTSDGGDRDYHFRWGLYSNDIPQEHTPLTNTVTELSVR